MPSTQPRQGGRVNSPQDEDEKKLDDEYRPDGGAESSSQNPGARADARRKTKRFRLDHKQTHFLMSEFAKKPNPDVADLERLSQEIPNFNQHQIKVWFQNRRARFKIPKPDDRDLMINMRAIPVGFNNVQAFHSPYKAICTTNVLVSSSGHFVTQPHAPHPSLPSTPDTRWPDTNGYPSPNVIAPSRRYTHQSDFVTPFIGSSTMWYPFTQEHWQGNPIETLPVESPSYPNSSTSQTPYTGLNRDQRCAQGEEGQDIAGWHCG